MKCRTDYMAVYELAREMFGSLRDIDNRVNELIDFVKDGFCLEEKKQEIKNRVERLLKTRMYIVYSLMDIKADVTKFIDSDDAISLFNTADFYSKVKRDLGKIK